ncbi:hypothetical protein VTO73DRAFT_3486 [Trametes versicolor]
MSSANTYLQTPANNHPCGPVAVAYMLRSRQAPNRAKQTLEASVLESCHISISSARQSTLWGFSGDFPEPPTAELLNYDDENGLTLWARVVLVVRGESRGKTALQAQSDHCGCDTAAEI